MVRPLPPLRTPVSPWWRPWCLAGLLLLSAASGLRPHDALAGTEAEAELVRLDENLRKLASRNAWDGVEDIYSRMRSLEAKGATLSSVQHELGAESALHLGRMREARGRFGLARKATEDPAEKQRYQGIIEDIDRRFGSVVLTAPGKARRNAAIKKSSAEFSLDARKAIEHANAEVQLSGKFEGLLPIGDYTFGATAFSLTSDGGVVRVDASAVVAAAEEAPKPEPGPKPEKPKREPKPKPERSAEGPSAYAGVGVGSASWVSRTDPGYYVPGGTGLSARLGGGVRVPVGPLALVGEVGWDGMFGSGGEKTAVNMATLGAGLSFGSAVRGRVLGQVGIGRASVVGVDPAPACLTDDWQVDAPADGYSCESSAHWATSDIDYMVVSPGMVLGAAYAPDSLSGVAITVDFGIRGVSGQVIPWTALGARYAFGGGAG